MFKKLAFLLGITLIAQGAYVPVASATLYDDLRRADRCEIFKVDKVLEYYFTEYLNEAAPDYTPVGEVLEQSEDTYNIAIGPNWNDIRPAPDYGDMQTLWFQGMGAMPLGACWHYYEIVPTTVERVEREYAPQLGVHETRLDTAESDIAALEVAVASIPDDLGDLAAGADSNHFTDADEAKLDGIASGATANQTDSYLLNRSNHTGSQTADTLTDGVTNKVFTGTEKTKLAGIASGATANSSDATLLNRANHTGTQSADTITDGSTNKAFTAVQATKLNDLPTAASLTSSLAGKFNTPTGTTSQYLRGDGSVANGPNTIAVYDNTTLKTGVKWLLKTGTVSGASVVFYLTSDNTASGTALCTNTPYMNGVMLRAVEGTTPHAFGDPAMSNSNRTMTIGVSKLGTVLGILALNQSANGSTVTAAIPCD